MGAQSSTTKIHTFVNNMSPLDITTIKKTLLEYTLKFTPDNEQINYDIPPLFDKLFIDYFELVKVSNISSCGWFFEFNIVDDIIVLNMVFMNYTKNQYVKYVLDIKHNDTFGPYYRPFDKPHFVSVLEAMSKTSR